jgi:hypothetical protein
MLLNQLGQDQNMKNNNLGENPSHLKTKSRLIKVQALKQDKLLGQIKDFDEWFRYAEEIGEHRLYNYLMASSIILVAYATLLASNKENIGAHWLAIFLALFGILTSIMWLILGRRQKKFHDMFDNYIDRLCDEYDQKEKLAIYQVRKMKRVKIKQILKQIWFNLFHLTKEKRMVENQQEIKLSCLELLLSDRQLYWIIPLLFVFIFFSAFMRAWPEVDHNVTTKVSVQKSTVKRYIYNINNTV